MAPKKEPPKPEKPEKPETPGTKDPKKPGEAPKGPKGPPKWKTLIESKRFRNLMIGVSGCLVSIAVLLCVLTYFEGEDSEELFKSVSLIQESLGRKNVVYPNETGVVILNKGRELADELAMLHTETTHAINEISRMGSLLSEGAKPYEGSIYLFADTATVTMEVARSECERQQGYLVVATSKEEANFLDKQVIRLRKSYWIGIHKPGTNWQWLNGEPLLFSNWATGQPAIAPGAYGTCVEIQGTCRTEGKCWGATWCTAPRRSICKFDRDPRLIV